MFLKQVLRNIKSVGKSTSTDVSKRLVTVTPSWALASNVTKVFPCPWTAHTYVQTFDPMLATFLKSSPDVQNSFLALQPQLVYSLIWKTSVRGIIKGEVVCPGRVYRRTVSRGAIVRKKASRDQYEAKTAHSWQSLMSNTSAAVNEKRSYRVWLMTLWVTMKLIKQLIVTQPRTAPFKYIRRTQVRLSIPCAAVVLL